MNRDAVEDLEPFRKYLTVLAELHLDRKLRGKLGPSDVVQQTMLRAYSAIGELRSRQPEVLVVWLRRILARTLADAVKHYERDRRDVGLERSLEADIDRSASGFAAWLAADQTSPSGRAERNEELLRMVGALAELPDQMRRSGRLEALPGLDLAAHRRAHGQDRASRRFAVTAGAGRDAQSFEGDGVSRGAAMRGHRCQHRRRQCACRAESR